MALNLHSLHQSLRGDAVPTVAKPFDQVPNVLTILRIAMVPVVAVLLLRAGDHCSMIAAAIFAGAAATDQLDGYLARRWHVESPFGRQFDVLADRLMIFSSITVLAIDDRLSWIALIILLVREVAIGVVRALMPRGFQYTVSRTGKASAWVMYAGLVAIVAEPPPTEWPRVVFAGGVALSVISGALYLNTARTWRRQSTTEG